MLKEDLTLMTISLLTASMMAPKNLKMKKEKELLGEVDLAKKLHPADWRSRLHQDCSLSHLQ